jgi:hypothetical protein
MISKNTLLIAIAAGAAVATSAFGQCNGGAYTGTATICVGGVGSSAQFQTAALAAYQFAVGSTSSTLAGHYTAKNAGEIIDSRDTNIVPQVGNLAVVWDNATTPKQVWYYLSVDSVVGNRAYFAQPRTKLDIPSTTLASGQLIATALWGADAATLPTAVYNFINNSQFTAAFTDILPADAKFAQNRVNCGTSTTATLGCLGYGTTDANVGANIDSTFSSTTAQPVNFNIYGSDPISGNAIPAATVVPVGVAPIVFLDNRTNSSGLGYGVTATSGGVYNDIQYQATALLLYTGVNCNSSAFPVSGAPANFAINPISREPLSGTYNTAEFNIFVTNALGSVPNLYFSQESSFNSPYVVPTSFGAIQPATNNPLNGACATAANGYASSPQGARKRALGTGEMVSSVKATADSIGYIFFGYGNVSSIAASTSYGYLQYGGVDPINPSGSYNTPYSATGLNWPGYGQLPTCTVPCSITPGTSFPNIRSGAYQAWSLLRAVADAGTTSLTYLTSLAGGMANEINGTEPDFLPYSNSADGDPGFIAYRQHFAPGDSAGTPTFNFNSGNQWNNGPQTYSGVTFNGGTFEAGGDVGGCLDYKYDSPNTNYPNGGCRH